MVALSGALAAQFSVARRQIIITSSLKIEVGFDSVTVN